MVFVEKSCNFQVAKAQALLNLVPLEVPDAEPPAGPTAGEGASGDTGAADHAPETPTGDSDGDAPANNQITDTGYIVFTTVACINGPHVFFSGGFFHVVPFAVVRACLCCSRPGAILPAADQASLSQAKEASEVCDFLCWILSFFLYFFFFFCGSGHRYMLCQYPCLTSDDSLLFPRLIFQRTRRRSRLIHRPVPATLDTFDGAAQLSTAL